jgi:hypothetical protein
MTAPEIMAAFARRRGVEAHDRPRLVVYPLYVATGVYSGTWYIRERVPGTRIWRAEEDGSFRLLDAFDTPSRLASPANLLGCRERDW